MVFAEQAVEGVLQTDLLYTPGRKKTPLEVPIGPAARE